MCRPLPKSPDGQNSPNDKASKRVLPNMDPKGKPLTKPPDIHYANEDRVNYRPPPKPPYILNVDGEMIGIIEKKHLLNTEPNYRPPPNPPKFVT